MNQPGTPPSLTPLRSMEAHNNLHALLFQATSAEYVALCHQAYQLARHALLARLQGGTFCNPAIVFDLDETVLDNHAYQAWQIQAGTNYDDGSWNRWCAAEQAEAVPGALEFIRFVEAHGVVPIFITSRSDTTRAATLRNLHALGVISDGDLESELTWASLPILPDSTRLFMKGMRNAETPTPSDKNRQVVLGNKFQQRTYLEQFRGFEVILSVGDNLGDYAEYYGRVYDKTLHTFYEEAAQPGQYTKLDGKHPSVAERRDSVEQDAALFGRDFILIPNPTYGGWLRAFEANLLGSSDELAGTGVPVRQGIAEPKTPFVYANPKAGQTGQSPTKTAQPVGPKFNPPARQFRVWDGNP